MSGSARLPWATVWQIARRDLNARFKGLRLLVLCIFLGTAALAAIGTLTAAIERELASSGQELLGGDVEVALWQRALSDEERGALAKYGTVSEGYRLQAMALAGDNAAPVELKAVDAKWPLFGTLTLTDGRSVGAPQGTDAWLAKGALDRLGIAVGDNFSVGGVTLRAAGVIENEPDRLSEGFQLGPTVVVAENVPRAAGLLEPGSLYQSKHRIALMSSAPAPDEVEEALTGQFPSAGFTIRTRDRASPGADRFVRQMSDFLTLVGLAALMIAGIGIAGGVSSYLDQRRTSIATFKVLGATSLDIVRIYALQIAIAALVGSALGLAAGVLVTPLLAGALQGLLPVQSGFVIKPARLVLAASYGLLVAFTFAAAPLLRARAFPAMALMRSGITPLARDWRALGATAVGLAAISALALATTAQPRLSGGFLLGAGGALVVLAGLGWALQRAARALPRPANPILRSALANLHRPGAPTGALVTALGFGLAAFVLIAAVQSAIDGNIQQRVPQEAPDYFVLDVPRDKEPRFFELVQADFPEATIRTVPTLRGKVLAFGPRDAMTRVADMARIPDSAWSLRGERGLTYSDQVPLGNRVVAGEWWSPFHSGEPLVSVDAEQARAIGVDVGDYITIGILGVERTARVANLREVDWENLGFNFTLVFSRNALADAPHNLSATIDLPDGADDAARGALLRALVQEFPSSSVVEIGGLIVEGRKLLQQVALATLAAAAVTVLAGLAVLLGAIAAARAARTYDTVVLRVLGASRRQILLLQLAEYGMIAGLLALVALALGGVLAWIIITAVFSFDWLPDWRVVTGVLGIGLALVLLFALAGSLPLLKAKPARALREL
ncbi:MAG: ABC transporter permease [Erythrobacter sp. SCN 62-14]|nr:MAG: ABC transporter permease [Erythrobacter sp. SCN 62-14]